MKRTKIVATMGPASNSPEKLTALIHAGLNVARLNFSHGEHAVHAATIQTIRSVDETLGTHTAILADLQGPKLRIGDLEGGSIDLQPGAQLTIRTGREIGHAGTVYTTYSRLPGMSRPANGSCSTTGKSSSAWWRQTAKTRWCVKSYTGEP